VAEGDRPPEFGADVDLRYHAGVLYRGRWLVVAAAILGAVLATFIAYLQTPEYQAATLVQIEPPVPFFVGVDQAFSGGGYWQNADFYNTQFRIITSKVVADRVVEELKLKDKPEFRDASDPSAILLSRIIVEPVPESRLTYIRVTHADREEAALWANRIADVYIRTQLDQRVENAKKAFDWLQERLANTARDIKIQQDKLSDSMKGDLIVPEGTTSAVNSSIEKLQGELVDAQSRRIDLQSAYRQASAMRQRGETLESVKQISQDPTWIGIQAQIVSLQLSRGRLRERLREAHPDVVRIDAEIGALEAGKAQRSDELLKLMRAELDQLTQKESELRRAVEDQKAIAKSQSRKTAELEIVKKQADSAEGLYEVLLQKLNESNLASSLQTNNVTLIERAVPPDEPVKPNKRQAGAIGLALGLLLGAGLVLARDYFDNTIKDPDDVERYLHQSLLAAVPKYEENNVHLVTEAYQSLRTALIFARREDSGQVVLVTGTAPQEGKTSTLVNLGKLLAASGEKTLIFDLDLRRAQIHRRLGVQKEPGFSDYFTKREDLDELVQGTRSPNLYVLTAGALPPNPPALIARRQMADLLDRLRRHFDWILVDSPPLASVTDALLIARYCDLAVYIVQHNKIDKKVIKRSIQALEKATPNLVGVVVNALDTRTRGYYYYYYSQDQKRTGEVARPAAPDAPEARADLSRPA
jgi:capsular exopolysaccharide synthesis family protein